MKELTIEAIFEQFGGPSAIGRVIGMSRFATSAMLHNRTIPIKYWGMLINSATGRSIGLDADGLMRACLKGRGK